VYHLYDHDEEPELIDRQLLTLLLDSFEQARPSTLKELEAHGESEAVLASLRRLSRYGLINRLGFYVIASGPAIFYHHLIQRFDEPTA
jgi:hypothetical protein